MSAYFKDPPVTVGYFWHDKNGLMPTEDTKNAWKTLDVDKLSEINIGKKPMTCQDGTTDENGGLKSVAPVVQFLKSEANKSFLSEKSDAKTEIHYVVVQSAVLVSMLVCGHDETIRSTYSIHADKEVENLISIEWRSEADMPKRKSRPTVRTYVGSYADSKLTITPECLKDKQGNSSGQTFGEKCSYIVVRHRATFTEKNGTRTIVNLFISKEVDAVANKSDSEEKVLIDLKVYPYVKFWNRESLRHDQLRCLIMDFLVNGFVYVVGLRQRKTKHEYTQAWVESDVFHKRIDKVVILEKISSFCESEERNEFISNLPLLLHRLVKQYNKDKFSTLKRAHQSPLKGAKVLLTYEEGTRGNLTEVICVAEQLVKSGSFEPCRHHLVIVGTFVEPVPVETEFCHGDCISVEIFSNRYFAEFMCKPEKISVYGTQEEFDKVMKVLTDKEKKITSHIIYKPDGQKIVP